MPKKDKTNTVKDSLLINLKVTVTAGITLRKGCRLSFLLEVVATLSSI